MFLISFSSSSEELSKSTREVEDKVSQIKSLKEELSKFKLESSSLKEQLDASKNKFVEETSMLEKASAEAASRLTADIEAAKASLKEKESEKDSLKAQILDLEKINSAKIENLKKEISDKEEQLSKVTQVGIALPFQSSTLYMY